MASSISHDRPHCLPLPCTATQVAAPHPALGGAFEKAARLLLPQGVRDRAYDTVRFLFLLLGGSRLLSSSHEPLLTKILDTHTSTRRLFVQLARAGG